VIKTIIKCLDLIDHMYEAGVLFTPVHVYLCAAYILNTAFWKGLFVMKSFLSLVFILIVDYLF